MVGFFKSTVYVFVYRQYHSICVDIDKFFFGIIIWWKLVLDNFFSVHVFYRPSLCCIRHCSDHESIVNVEFFSSTLSMHREPGLLWQRQFSFLRCKEVGNDDCEKPSKSCKEKYFPDLRQVLQSLRRIECWEKAKCFPYILVRSNKSVQSVWHHYKINACSWNLLPASSWKSMFAKSSISFVKVASTDKRRKEHFC